MRAMANEMTATTASMGPPRSCGGAAETARVNPGHPQAVLPDTALTGPRLFPRIQRPAAPLQAPRGDVAAVPPDAERGWRDADQSGGLRGGQEAVAAGREHGSPTSPRSTADAPGG